MPSLLASTKSIFFNASQTICSSSEKLEEELQHLCNIFSNNGYPIHIVNKVMKIALTTRPRTLRSKPCPVYVKLPWIGNGRSEAFEKLFDQATRHAYPMCQTRVCFFSKQAFRPCPKDGIPAHHKSNVMYSCTCRCRCRYVGKTTQRLEARIKQHIPAYLYKPGNQKNPLRQPLENIWKPILPLSTPSTTSSSLSLPQHATNRS